MMVGRPARQHPSIGTAQTSRHAAIEAEGNDVVRTVCGLARSDVFEAGKLDRPDRVVVADNDPGIDEAAMKKTFLAWHPNAELVLIPNCGHYPMQECPPYLATVIEKFLRRQIV